MVRSKSTGQRLPTRKNIRRRCWLQSRRKKPERRVRAIGPVWAGAPHKRRKGIGLRQTTQPCEGATREIFWRHLAVVPVGADSFGGQQVPEEFHEIWASPQRVATIDGNALTRDPTCLVAQKKGDEVCHVFRLADAR